MLHGRCQCSKHDGAIHATVPIGVVLIPLPVSLTVAVQLDETPTVGAPQLTFVVVGRMRAPSHPRSRTAGPVSYS